jgi:regulator of sigma E protease
MQTEENGAKEKRKMLGIKSVNATEVTGDQMTFVPAVAEAVKESWRITEVTLRGVAQIIKGDRGGEEIGGIVRIAEMSGDISKNNNVLDLLMFMALLSINLGLINLFPIPALDGGHVLFSLVEIVTRKQINEKAKEFLLKIGISLLLALLVFATWNDFVRLFNRWFS